MMEYTLKNGETVTIREPKLEDAQAIIRVMAQADRESLFLAREPGEFNCTEEQEQGLIRSVLEDPGRAWFVPEYRGRVVGQCSVALVRRNLRYLHRAETAFVLLKDCWGLGIGGKMMEACIAWCKEHDIEQLELEVLTGNRRALAMYMGFGFQVTGTIPHALRYADGSYGDEYKMVKYL